MIDAPISATGLTGWSESTTNAVTNRFAIADGTAASANVVSFGASAATDRALGGGRGTGFGPRFGATFVNATGQSLAQFTISFTEEQWRQVAAANAFTQAFEYKIAGTDINDASGWTAVTALDLTTLKSGTAGGLDGNQAANRAAKSATITGVNWGDGQNLLIRWGVAIGSAGPGLAIDDFTLTTPLTQVAPSFTSANSSAFKLSTPSTFQVVATGNPTVTGYSLTGAPAWLSINSTTGLLSGTAPAIGTYTFSIVATNGVVPDATQNFTLSVPAPYASVTSIYTQNFDTLSNNGTYTLSDTVPTDLNQAPLLFSGVDGWSISTANAVANRFVVDDGSSNAAGVYSEGTVGATDRALGAFRGTSFGPRFGATFLNASNTTQNDVKITFTEEEWRRATAANAPNSILTFEYQIGGTDINDASGWIANSALDLTQLVNGSATALNGNAAANRATKTLTLNGLNWAPNQTLLIRWGAAAGAAGAALAIDDFRLEFPHSPTITSANTTTFAAGSNGSFQVRDDGFPAANYSLSGAPAWLSINTTTGVLSGTPSGPDVGIANFTIVAGNGIAPDATQPFSLTVIGVPNLTLSTPTPYVDPGANVTYTATVGGSLGAGTGNITFKDGANTLATLSLDGSGSASFTQNNLTTIGTHLITAVYSGDSNYLAATSFEYPVYVRQAFGSGNLVVVQVGTGTSANVNTTGTQTFLTEISIAGSVVQSVPLPVSNTGSNKSLVLSGSQAQEGALNLSSDGNYLTLGGFNAAPGTTSVTGTATRVVALIDADAHVDTSTSFNDNTGNYRSTDTVNGAGFWTTANSSATGVRYVSIGNTGASTPVQGSASNARALTIFNGQLYASFSDTNYPIAAIGAGLPTTTGNTVTPFTGITATAASSFVLLDRDSNGVPDSLYVAYQSTNGISKFSSTDGINWTSRGVVSNVSSTGLTAVQNGNGTIDLYWTQSANKIVALTDTTAFDAAFTGTPTVLYTAPANTVLEGLAFAPTTNDLPVVTAAAQPLNVTANGPAIAIDANLTLTDTDSSTLSGAQVILGSGYVNGEDTLVFTNQNGITGAFNAANGTLTLTGYASLASYQSALQSVQFLNSNATPTLGSRSVSFSIQDRPTFVSTGARTVNVVAASANQAPVVNANQTFSINENAANSVVVGTAAATDLDGPALQNWAISTGNTNGAFAINPSTGQITVANSTVLDREAIGSFTLTLTVSDGTSTSSPQNITINLNDVNDVTPVVTANQTFALNENSGNGTVLGSVVATDGDVTATTFQNWAITGGNTGGAFAINPSSGQITVANSTILDREAISSFTLQVTVSDGVNTSATQNVTVNLNDVNDITPIVTANQTFALNENSGNGTVLGTVVATDGDVTATTFQNWAITGGNTGGTFAINPSSGQITVANSTILDREAVSSFTLQVSVSDGVNTSATQNVTVNLNDVNDVTPIVTANQTFAINENSGNGTVVGSVVATDGDVTATTFQNWAITGGNTGGAFAINPSSGQITVANSTVLDREAVSSFTLQVTVSDGVNTSATQNVTVNLNDVNDITPIVTANQTFALNENSGNGTVVGTLVATDGDVTATTFQNWAITTGNTGGAFSINPSSGQITVANSAALDREVTSSFALQVTVSDGVNTSATQNITINLNDVNDVTPIVTPSQTFGVASTASNGTLVGTVGATDGDVTATTFQSWAITGGNTGSAFAINASTGAITVANSAALSGSFALQVTVSDGVHTSAVQTVAINVATSNLNTPVITSGQTFALNENSANTTVAGTVAATDADSGTTLQNWTITGGNTGGAFAINSSSGQITVANSTVLDREAVSSFTLQLTVSDGVNTSSAQNVTINLNDVNDVTPVVAASQTFALNENSGNGTAVGTVVATDGDVTATTFQNWTITGGNTGGAFAINASNGQITVANSTILDREAISSFTLQVTVSDGVQTSSAQNVTINLNDANDVTPIVTANQTFALNENSGNGTAVGTVVATDGDVTATTFQNWTITGGNTGGAFAINPSTGQITVANSTILDREAISSFTLQVTVSDGVQTSSAQNVTINLNDVNDVTPVVTASQTFALNENSGNGTAVGAVVATDGDVTATTFQNWAITGGNTGGAFAINPSTGQITVANSTILDREAVSSFTLQVTVSDSVHTSSAQNVTINLNDVNDVTPVVTNSQSFNVASTATNGTLVGNVAATDGDVTATTFQNWAITGGNTGGAFALNASTGAITVANSAALTGSFALQITVSDGVHTSSAQSVAINVTSSNANPPVITASQTFALNENSANTTVVGTVAATDADSGTTFQNWAITGGNTGNAFAINPSSGQITVANSTILNREAISSFILQVTVSDGVNTSSVQNVTINLNDVNDVTPVVTASQTFALNENSGNGTAVGTVVATDGDVTATTFQNWAITGGNTGNAFAINPSSGQITVANSTILNREAISSFTLQVTVSDGVNTSSAQNVTINLNDVNDVTPVVTASQTFALNENSGNGTVVGTVVTTDGDVTATTFQNWAITGGNTGNAFAINPSSGQITVANSTILNREAISSFTLQVTVSDGVNTSSAQNVTINLNDVNDVAPVVNANQSFSLSSGSANGTTVGAVLATDGDVTATTFQNWAITGGNTGSAFAINPATGQITVANSAAVVGSFALQVTVSDGVQTSAARTVNVQTLSANNVAPTLLTSDLFFSTAANSSSATLNASDTDPLSFSATIDSVGHYLRAKYNLTYDPARINYGGQQEKWFTAPSGVPNDPVRFFILPNGDFYQWNRATNRAQGTKLETVSTLYFADPTRVITEAAGSGPLAFSVGNSTGQLTFGNPSHVQGQFLVTATVSDGALSVTKSFKVNFINLAPTLAPISNVNLAPSQDTYVTTLSATDPENDALTYSATVQSQAQLLDAKYNFTAAAGPNNGSLRIGEKWVTSGGTQWFYILPSGDLFQWDGTPYVSQGTFLANVGTNIYARVNLLVNPSAAATAWTNGSSLTVDPNLGFKGNLVVTAKVADSSGLFSTQTFTVTVAPKPTLTQPSDVSVVGTAPIPVTLTTSDPSGLPLTYRVTNEAAVLQATYGLSATSAVPASVPGAKWLVGAGSGVYYYLLSNGELHRYDQRAAGQKDTLVRTVDARYFIDPTLLTNAANQATFSFVNNVLTVTPRAGFRGKLVLTVFADNGANVDSKTFTITVS